MAPNFILSSLLSIKSHRLWWTKSLFDTFSGYHSIHTNPCYWWPWYNITIDLATTPQKGEYSFDETENFNQKYVNTLSNANKWYSSHTKIYCGGIQWNNVKWWLSLIWLQPCVQRIIITIHSAGNLLRLWHILYSLSKVPFLHYVLEMFDVWKFISYVAIIRSWSIPAQYRLFFNSRKSQQRSLMPLVPFLDTLYTYILVTFHAFLLFQWLSQCPLRIFQHITTCVKY